MQEIITLALGGVNCYLIKNKGNYLLIDTGGHMFLDKQYDNRSTLLEEKLREYGVNASNCKGIILTHGDNDHTCNAKRIAKLLHSKIIMHRDDVWMVNHPSSSCYKVNNNYKSIILKIVFCIMSSKIQKLMDKVYDDFETFEPDVILEADTDMEVFGFDGMIYSVPGHTKGSICILDEKGNLICGDMFTNNGKPSIAINAEDFTVLKESAKKILSKSVKMVFPGHGDVFRSDEL